MEDNNNKNINQKRIVTASIVALILMLLFGLSHRILANMLLYSGEKLSIDPNALAKFPMDINEWAGFEVPLDEAVIEATGTDAHISRGYSRNNGLEYVSLYVAFGQRARDLMPHRPEVCYIGAGWTLIDSKTMDLTLEEGTKLPCTILQFSKGTLIQSKIVVLDYYIVDGEFSRDVSLLRSKIWKGSGAVNYTAQIQITKSISTIYDSESATKIIYEFAKESAPLLRQLLASVNVDESVIEQNLDVNNVPLKAKGD